MEKIVEKNHEEILDKLIILAENLDFREENYLVSYPIFLKYFSSLEKINLDNLIIGISFTYAWMPTILEFKNNKFDEALKILNKAKCNENLEIEDFIILKSLLNNSLVGTSKLLHFINPKKYAIWDSRVFYFLNKDKNIKPHNYRVENIDSYLNYLRLLNDLIKTEKFNGFYKIVNDKLNGEVTEFRAIELVMFQGGKKTNEL
jgi:hypothetical protein